MFHASTALLVRLTRVVGAKIQHAASMLAFLLLLAATANAQTAQIASLTSPQNGMTQVAPTVQFAWTAVGGAQAYYLYVGSAPGLKDVYDGGETLKTAVTVKLAPATTYYARLYTESNGIWQYAPDVSFTTIVSAAMLSPANNASAIQSPVQFTWSTASSASGYYLYVGTTLGAKDVVDSGQIPGTQLSRSLNQGTYYARVYTLINGIWYASSDITFSVAAPPSPAQLTFPTNGATQIAPTVAFNWNAVAGAQFYYLYVGSAPGLKDVYDGGQTTATSANVRLSSGLLYYARLYTEINNQWLHAPDVSFTTTQQSNLTAPANGSSLDGSSPVNIAWAPISGAAAYYLYVGTTLGAKDALDTGAITYNQISRSFPAGTYYARIYTEFGQSWYASQDISFSVVADSKLVSPGNGATNVDPAAGFTWTAVASASGYSLSVGTSMGASDAFSTGALTTTSFQNSAPLLPSTTYYATLGTLQGTNWIYTASSFTTGTGIAHLLSPTNGAINIDPYTRLRWNAIANAQKYYVYVGSALGLKDVYDSGEITATRLAVHNLQPNTLYFVRLYTEINSMWYSTDTTFTTGYGIAQMIYPSKGATNVDPTIPFSWSSDPRALNYRLNVGTTAGASDIYDSGATLDTSRLVSLHAAGTYYIRILTQRTKGWWYADTTFTLGDFIAHLTNPPNQGVADPFAPFTWTSVPGTTAYYLYVGTTVGANDVVNSGQVTVNSLYVHNLVPGTNYCARMYTFRGGLWLFSDTTFIAGQGVAQLTDPLPGAAISPFEQFTWAPPNGAADAYYLTIGSTPGARDVFDSGPLTGTSILPAGLDFSQSYYATLYTLKYNIWRPSNSTFTTLDQSSVPNLPQLKSNFYSEVAQTTAAVRMMADPATNIAVPGTPLDLYLQQNGYTAANCFMYAQVLQAQLIPQGINARLRGITLTGTSYEAHTPLEYYDPFQQKWSVADPTFGIMYFDPNAQVGQSVEEIQALVVANNFSSLHIMYLTTLNDTVLRNYYMDPITLYLNVYPPGQQLGPLQNSPLQFLKPVDVQGIEGQSSVYPFSFGSSNEQLDVVIGQNIVTLTPVDGTMFSRAISVPTGWTVSNLPSDAQAYTFIRPVF